jgi:hypothetical protein
MPANVVWRFQPFNAASHLKAHQHAYRRPDRRFRSFQMSALRRTFTALSHKPGQSKSYGCSLKVLYPAFSSLYRFRLQSPGATAMV